MHLQQSRSRPFIRAVVATLTLICTAAPLLEAGVAAPVLHLRPASVRQGDALFLRLLADGEAKVRWLGKTYPLHQDGRHLAAALPIPPDTSAGGHKLVIEYEASGDRRTLERTVEVHRVAFPVQYLRMAKGTARQYSAPGVKQADRAVTGALYTRSDERRWKGQWRQPVVGTLGTGFGVRRLRNGKAVGRHHGLDISAPTGRPITAPAACRDRVLALHANCQGQRRRNRV